MKRAEYPATSCREPLSSGAGLVYLCEIVIEHPGPCASFSIPRTVTARNAWEMTHSGWESDVGTKDLIVTSPNFPGERATVKAPQEKESTMETKAAPRYRRFRTSSEIVVETGEERYLLVEVEGTDKAPLNWTDGLVTEKGAWDRARSQALPVVAIPLHGDVKHLGLVFHPRAFEKAAYRGYVSYGISMTDGTYHPEAFETWVKNFRREVSEGADDIIGLLDGPSPEMMLLHDKVWGRNDASNDVKCALGAYAKAIKERGL